MLVVEGAIFAIDDHGHVRREVEMLQFGDRAAVFHVSGIIARAKDDSDLDCLIGVGRCDEGTASIVDQGRHFDRKVL